LWYLGLLASSEPSLFQGLQSTMLCIAAATFAYYRVAAFHPYVRDSYRNWLMTTCWRVGRPLPLGPLTLTFSDALLLALATGLVWHAHTPVPSLTALELFAALYLLLVAFSLLCEGPRGGGYAVVFGLLGMLMFARQPAIACVIALPTYWIACLGLRRSLARLPNYEPGCLAKNIATRVPRGEQVPFQRAMAWPFAYLAPHEQSDGLPRFDVVCLALLAGWAFFSLTVVCNQNVGSFLMPDSDASRFYMIGWFFCGFTAAARLYAYYVHFRPPISLLGRFATGRWLIPSYDRGLVAPLGSLFVLACIEPGLLGLFQIPMAVAMSIMLTLALLVALIPGPSFGTWALTSECRIVPTRPQ
jgi:hypothetical protein